LGLPSSIYDHTTSLGSYFTPVDIFGLQYLVRKHYQIHPHYSFYREERIVGALSIGSLSLAIEVCQPLELSPFHAKGFVIWASYPSITRDACQTRQRY
jgi:hypothetical protein